MFLIPEDIGNRALQHLGATRVQSPDSLSNPQSKNASEAGFLYDKCRRAELRAHPWTFAARRSVIRAAVAASRVVYPTWSSSTSYAVGDVVLYTANNQTAPFIAITASMNQIPINNLSFWRELFMSKLINPFVAGTVYYPGEIVLVGGTVYINISGLPSAPSVNNIGPPVWHPLSGVSLVPFFTTAPLQFTTGSIGASQSIPLKSIFPMPFGYLRPMSQDAKTAGTPYQVTTGGAAYTDFEYEEGLLLSALPGPLVFRFGADIQSVGLMEDLFCEMLACRMGLELCEVITQSPQKLVNLKGLYDGYKMEATRLALIEAGSTEMVLDDVNVSRAPTLERPRSNQPQVKR